MNVGEEKGHHVQIHRVRKSRFLLSNKRDRYRGDVGLVSNFMLESFPLLRQWGTALIIIIIIIFPSHLELHHVIFQT